MNRGLISSLIFALGFVLFFLLVMPQYDSYKNASELLTSRKATLSERASALEKFQTFDGQVKERGEEINKILTFLPKKKQIDEVISSVNQTSQESGLQLIEITTSAALTSADAPYEKLIVGMNLIGRYPALVTFLTKLEKNLRLYDIFEIITSLSSLGAEQGQLNITIKLNAYYLAAEK